MSSNHDSNSTDRSDRISGLPWAIVSLILIATVIDGMDTTIVNIILPQMSEALGMNMSSSAFIIVTYIVPIAGLCIFLGKLADRVDLRRFFIAGTMIFLMASISCALSFDSVTILASRFFQGLGAAFMVASTPIMVVRLLPEDARGRGMAVIATGTGFSSIIGAPLGGAIEELLSWNWVFIINIPLCIMLIVLSMRVLPRGNPVDVKATLPDTGSTVTMFIGMGVLMTALYLYIDGLVDATVAVIGIVVSASLLLVSVWTSYRSERPLMDPRLIGDRRFMTVSVVFLLSTLMGAGVLYLLPFYLNIVEDMGSLQASLILAVSSVIAVVSAAPTGRWCDSRGCRTPACISLALRALFCLGLAFVASNMNLVYMVAVMVVMGLSFGISGTSQSTRMVVESSEGLEGDAGVMAMLVNYVGYAVGVAVFATMMTWMVPDMDSMTAGTFLQPFHLTMVVAMLIALVALVLSLMIRERKVLRP